MPTDLRTGTGSCRPRAAASSCQKGSRGSGTLAELLQCSQGDLGHSLLTNNRGSFSRRTAVLVQTS